MKTHPAESAGLAGAVALLVGRLAGVADVDVLTAIGVAAAAVPAAVTLLVVSGGVRGLARKLWRGKA